MDAGVFVTLAGITPVKHIDAAVRPACEIHAAKPGIAENHGIRFVPCHIAAAVAFQAFGIEARPAVEIDRQQLPLNSSGQLPPW